jgi:hypothetical protein
LWCSKDVWLSYLMPMLVVVHFLIKSIQLQDVFVCNFIATISICKTNLFQMYFNQTSGFRGDAFKHFNQLVDCTHETIYMKWIIDLNIKLDHLAFVFGG